MGATTVGIRELKTRLSQYMERVQAGGTVIITDHGRPVGRIIPIGTSLETQLQELVQARLLAWSGKKLARRTPVAHVRGKRTVSDLLIEDRE